MTMLHLNMLSNMIVSLNLVKSELGKGLLENVAKEDLLKILYNRIAYVVDESLMPEYD